MIRISSIIALVAIIGTAGCHTWMSKEKEKNNQFIKEHKRFKDLLVDPERPRLIGEVAGALGMYAKTYDAFGLATDLPGTGGIVKPGVQRDHILADMRVRSVESPETVLDAPWTALVKLKVFANPCDEKGEIVDVDVETSSECLATDLTGGFVLEARLKEMAFIDGSMRTSDDKAIAMGDIVMLPASYTKSEATPLKGVIIGGGKLLHEQRLGLQIQNEFRHVVITKAIEKSINARFFFRDANKQQLAAEGKNDWHIALQSIPKYRHDPAHFMSVILATGFAESEEEQMERVMGCKKLILNRETARRGAVELESIGNETAKQVLIDALSSVDPEIRFYAAYSLAYLDCKESVPVLIELARYEPAFRPLCLTGLAINEESTAREGLEELLQEAEPELRYGAFWSIRHRNKSDFVVNGEMVGHCFQLVQIPSAIPLIVVSLQAKKEVVLFGSSMAINLSTQLSPTPSIKLTPLPGNQIKLSKRQIDGEIRNAIASNDIVSVLKAMGNIDASYNDVVHTLETLANKHAMTTPLALNPRPFSGREYVRKNTSETISSTDSNMDVVKIDGSSLSPKAKSPFGFVSPASWFKPAKPATKKVATGESRVNESPGRTEEEPSFESP